MTGRAIYLYRLLVTLPEGSDEPGWEPEGWEDVCEERGWIDRESDTGAYTLPPFGWPRRRLYMSRSAAEERAKLLRAYGATVEVERSEQVTWAAVEDARAETVEAQVHYYRRRLDGYLEIGSASPLFTDAEGRDPVKDAAQYLGYVLVADATLRVLSREYEAAVAAGEHPRTNEPYYHWENAVVGRKGRFYYVVTRKRTATAWERVGEEHDA